ncbi:uncharacterized protein LOC109825447 [Asparagus officinalis]|uniref:uncharacterized protein LOC109825447 n=1 Tax=Asparagus officinalis TaxID=4686 RepID=UPI00098E0B5C|nr:uncharacterized protein LOC109825447 [Asparagus officinalis]
MDEDITIENNPTKPLNHNIEKHEENNPGTETQMDEDITTKNNPTKPLDHTIEKIKLEMEENGFEYLPPKAHPKIGYIHYRRQKIDAILIMRKQMKGIQRRQIPIYHLYYKRDHFLHRNDTVFLLDLHTY